MAADAAIFIVHASRCSSSQSSTPCPATLPLANTRSVDNRRWRFPVEHFSGTENARQLLQHQLAVQRLKRPPPALLMASSVVAARPVSVVQGLDRRPIAPDRQNSRHPAVHATGRLSAFQTQPALQMAGDGARATWPRQFFFTFGGIPVGQQVELDGSAAMQPGSAHVSAPRTHKSDCLPRHVGMTHSPRLYSCWPCASVNASATVFSGCRQNAAEKTSLQVRSETAVGGALAGRR